MEDSKENFINIHIKNDIIYLIKEAYKAMEFAYSPYSDFKVGAALGAVNSEGDEKIFTGCNIENGSYGATVCAERTAVFKAVSEGYRKINKIAIVSSGGEFTPPCGICRQVLSEFADGTAEVILHNKEKDMIKTYSLSELLPEAFELVGGSDNVQK